MKRHSKKLLALALTVCVSAGVAGLGTLAVFARSMAEAERLSTMVTDSPMDKTPEVITVTEGANEAAGAGPSCGYSLLLDGDDWLLTSTKNEWGKATTVSVPSSLSTALFKAGKLGDPTVGRNDAAAKELGNRTWYFRKTFNYNGSGKNVYLCFDGVADRMEAYINGTKVGSHQGMFGGPYIDVSEYLKKGENELVVQLKAVIDYTRTVVFNCSYAWHYADLPPIGIWNSVRIEDRSDTSLDHPFITTVSHKTGTMDMSIDITGPENKKIGGTVYCTVTPKNFEGKTYSFTYKLPAAEGTGDRNARLRFDLPEFKLWWPNGYGEQNLYTLETLFVDDNGGRSYASSDFGVRTLEMTSGARKETSNMYNRTPVVNGKALFLKGANWCTIDAAMNFTREDYDRILSRAYDQGINVFRSWGGGMVETENFYDLCDEYGILVYQEWPCCWDSQKTQPEAVLYETVELNTKRIRNRASLMVYGGGNEGEAVPEDKVMNRIGTLTYKYDGTRDFWRQDGGVGANGISHNHIHWGGEDPENYAEIYYNWTSNLHEYGLDAMMNMESIARFATKEEMEQWPIDPEGTIAYHTATFNGMKGWQQTPYGYDIDTFIHYASQFVEVDSLESLVKGSQIAQTMADYFSAFNSRVNFPVQSMVMYYKFNDVYPGASWAVVDYYGSPKMAYWFLQDAYAPLTAGLKADRYDTYNKSDKSVDFPVVVLDDADELASSNWKVVVKAYNSRLETVKESQFEGNGSVDMNKEVGRFTLTEQETDSAPLFLVTTLYKDGVYAARNYMFMNSSKDPGCLFAIPAADVEYTVSGNKVTLKNNSAVPAVGVYLSAGADSDKFRPSDNYIWLEPGETYTVDIKAGAVSSLEGFNLLDKSSANAPSVPKNLKAAAESYESIRIKWDKPGDASSVRYYELYVDGEMKGLIKGTASEYLITDLKEVTEYKIEIAAVGKNGENSGKTGTVKCVTLHDENPPYATTFEMNGSDSATVYFNRKVDPESASDTNFYVLNLGGKVVSAVPGSNGLSVKLTFEGLEGGLAGRTLTVFGVKDTSARGNRATRTCFKLDSKLVGLWTFDDKSKTLHDASNYHVKGGSADGAGYTEGNFGNAIKPGKNDIVLTETDLTLKNTVYSFWFKGGSFAGFNVLLAKGNKVTGHFEIYANEGELKLYCPELCDSSFGVSLKKYSGKWTHFCFTCNGTEVVCWVNGEKAGSVKIKNDISARNFELVLGSLPGGQFAVDGEFDEFTIVQTKNAEAVVQELYANTFINEISMEKASYRVKPETTTAIKINYKNVDANVALEWSSSDETVAAVNQGGTVTAVSEGVAFITVKTSSGKFIDRCIVEVGDFNDPVANGCNGGCGGSAAFTLTVPGLSAACLALFKRRKKREDI